MPSPSATLLTKWGRLSGAQWLAARHRDAMDEWWTPELYAYLDDHWPTPEQVQRRRTAIANRSRSRAPAPPQQLAIL